MTTIEQSFTCPYCGEPISFELDLSVNAQTYTEDCTVCCRPIEVQYKVRENEVREFSVRKTTS